jgi:hypothetical protein
MFACNGVHSCRSMGQKINVLQINRILLKKEIIYLQKNFGLLMPPRPAPLSPSIY